MTHALSTGDRDFAADVLDVVAAIPSGHVLSYGDIAAMLGSRAARQVGAVMAREGGASPWWRVVRANGQPPAGHESRALVYYRDEETPLKRSSDDENYRVDMRQARWRPS